MTSPVYVSGLESPSAWSPSWDFIERGRQCTSDGSLSPVVVDRRKRTYKDSISKITPKALKFDRYKVKKQRKVTEPLALPSVKVVIQEPTPAPLPSEHSYRRKPKLTPIIRPTRASLLRERYIRHKSASIAKDS